MKGHLQCCQYRLRIVDSIAIYITVYEESDQGRRKGRGSGGGVGRPPLFGGKFYTFPISAKRTLLKINI